MGLVGHVVPGCYQLSAADDTRWPWGVRLNILRAFPAFPLILDLDLDLFRESRWAVEGEGALGGGS